MISGRTTLKFRASYVSELIGKNKKSLRIHALDNSGEIECVSFGQMAEKLDKLIKVKIILGCKILFASRYKKYFFVIGEWSLLPNGVLCEEGECGLSNRF